MGRRVTLPQMAFEYSDDNVLRLAEVIFTKRMVAEEPRDEAAADRLMDENALFALKAAQSFAHAAEGWFQEDEGEKKKGRRRR